MKYVGIIFILFIIIWLSIGNLTNKHDGIIHSGYGIEEKSWFEYASIEPL